MNAIGSSTRRPMLKNGRNDKAFAGAYMGCSCCNSKQCRRHGKHGARQDERRAWRRDQGLA